jgi:hypothetical protein
LTGVRELAVSRRLVDEAVRAAWIVPVKPGANEDRGIGFVSAKRDAEAWKEVVPCERAIAVRGKMLRNR